MGKVASGFTLAPETKKGIGSKSLSAFMEHLFNTMNKYRIIATTECDNHAAYKLLERVGFRREAHFVNNIFLKGNRAVSINMRC
ncbi:GNAT family protein [Shewanella sp. GutDb-MelDb]|uniref:GNAT family N-acetyltransferase n=1 Tax=Shewanella sp. GutDb-MelDb TaxID=2058316 RepID=UPI0026B9E9A5|nr:GNAT family protein [Shewanella sp. GutDb-MelDb]